jgi:hypothetical protein
MDSDMNFTRGFSRPVFRVDLVPVFVDALRAMGLPDWVLVREKLYTHYADQVIELLVLYKDAFVAREASEKVWYVTQKPYPLDHASERVLAKVYDSKRKEQLAYDALCQVLSQQTDFKEYTQHAADWDLATKLI